MAQYGDLLLILFFLCLVLLKTKALAYHLMNTKTTQYAVVLFYQKSYFIKKHIFLYVYDDFYFAFICGIPT